MSTTSNIEWTDHTFNPWWGCTKVHQGCKNCYAEAWDTRWGGDHWGPKASRRMILGEWAKPEKWDREAREAGRVDRVFCASMCDIGEDFSGPVVDQQGKPVLMTSQTPERYREAGSGQWTVGALRMRTLDIIEQTPNLLWLLLTKRPENIRALVSLTHRHWIKSWPVNVMTGTSPSDQETADACIPALLQVPGRHFLSCEPLLGPIDFGATCKRAGIVSLHKQLHWVIVGGESGPGARPCDVGWIRSIVGQCRAAGTACFVKQVGSKPRGFAQWHHPDNEGHGIDIGGETGRKLTYKKGGDPAEWPEDLRVREFPKEDRSRCSVTRSGRRRRTRRRG